MAIVTGKLPKTEPDGMKRSETIRAKEALETKEKGLINRRKDCYFKMKFKDIKGLVGSVGNLDEETQLKPEEKQIKNYTTRQ